MHPQSSRVLSMLALVVTIAGCSGSRDESIRSLRCKNDDECPSGQMCREELCTDEDTVITDELDASADADASEQPDVVVDAAPDAVMTMPDGMLAVRAAGRTQGANATVDVSVEGAMCEPGACTLALGATVRFRAPQVAGYRFVNWSGDPGCMGESPELVLTNVAANIECVANYAWRLSVRGEVMGGNGEVAAASSAVAADCAGARCEVDQGQPVTLKAPVQPGFRFQGWAGVGCPEGSADNIEVKPVEGDIVCTAKFVPGFVIRGTTEGSSGAVVDVRSEAPYAQCKDSACQVDAGSRVTLTAPAVDGFRFAGFGGDAPCLTTAPSLVIESADADVECVAIYVARHQVSGTATGPTPAPALQATSVDTFATCSGSSCTVDHAGSARLFAPTVSGYRLRGWSGAGCMADAGAAQNLSNVTQDVACVAEYVLGVGVSGAAAGGANPTISAASSSAGAQCAGASCGIDLGGSVTLTTTQVAGFTFSGWTGDAGCASAQLSVTLSNVTDSRTCTANYTRLRYTVTGVVAPAGSGSIEFTQRPATAQCNAEGCTIDYGASLRLTAREGTGYDFERWDGCGNNATTPAIDVTNVQQAITCTARFRVHNWPLHVRVQPANGGGVTTPCGGAMSCDVTVAHNTDQALVAAQASGFAFQEWTGCLSPLAPNTSSASATLQRVTLEQTCTANFGHTVRAQVAPTGEGTVSNCFTAACLVAHNANLRLAAPSVRDPSRYEFANWSDCGNGQQADTSLQLSQIGTNLVCTANLRLRRFPVSVTINPAGAGAITMPCSGANSCSADITWGQPATLNVTQNSGYAFSGWTGCNAANPNALSTQIASVTSAQSCTANFNHVVTTSISPANIGGTTNCASGCRVNHGGSQALTAPAALGNYDFSGWDCGSGVVSTAPSFTLTPVNTNLACAAVYVRPSYRFDVQVLPAGAGRLSAPCDSTTSCPGSVLKGDTPTVTVAEGRGFRFTGWTGCSLEDASALSTRLQPATGAQTCTANFTPLYSLSVVSSPAGVSNFTAPCAGTACGGTYVAGSTPAIAVNAAPANYVFRRWSGCSVANATAGSTTLQPMMSSQICTAEFEHRVRVTTSHPVGTPTCDPSNPCYVVDQGTITLTPIRNANYTFTGWSGTGCPNNQISRDGSITINPVTTNLDCVANYTPIMRNVTVQILPVGTAAALGTVTPNCTPNGPCQVASGNSIQLTATPANTNIAFDGWSGCITSASATVNPVVTSDVVCTATFHQKGADLVVEKVTPSSVRRVALRDANGAPYDELQLVLTVTVANRGDLEATLDYTQSGGPKVAVTYGANAFLTSFKVAGSTDPWYGRLKMPIGAGTTQTLVGDIAVRLNKETIMPFTVDADSRSGDEIIPAFVRVQETNENNNKTSINVTVP